MIWESVLVCAFRFVGGRAFPSLKRVPVSERPKWKLTARKKIFHKICCHSATSLPKPLCFKHIAVVAARWEVAARPARQPNKPSQPHPQPLPEREGSSCAQGDRQVVTSNDTKTVHHSENIVFLRRKRCFPA